MDERALNELLECSVCLETLDANSKVLPCQHTFCRRCLDEIVSTKQELRCPECRTLVEIRVEDLPMNILLIRLLEGMKNATSGPKTTSSPSKAVGLDLRSSPTPKAVNSNLPCAKALYNYDAQEVGDLSFKKGDMVLLKKQVDENWYHGELNGMHGFFPASYVQVITPLPQEIPRCKALYDFILDNEDEKDCLTFQKDEMLTVIRRIDDNWAEGKLGEKIGIFPISFVEMNDAAKWIMNQHTWPGSRGGEHFPGLMGAIPQAGTSNMAALISPRVSEQNRTNSVASSVTATSTANSSAPPSVSGNNNNSESGGSSESSPNRSQPLSHPTVLAAKQSQKRHSLTALTATRSSPPQQQNRRSLELSVTAAMSLSPAATAVVSSNAQVQVTSATSVSKGASQVSQQVPAVPPKMSCSSLSNSNSSSSSSPVSPTFIYMALYNYKPQKEDEVELRKGDYYTVTEKCQDGWFKGTCLRTATVGVFPGNYVHLIKAPRVTGSSRLHHQASAGGLGQSGASKTPTPVSRAHSFPKTSPLVASMDYQIRSNQEAPRAPAPHPRTVTNTPQPQNNGVSHPRAVTNVTQPQNRNNTSTTVSHSQNGTSLVQTSRSSTNAAATNRNSTSAAAIARNSSSVATPRNTTNAVPLPSRSSSTVQSPSRGSASVTSVTGSHAQALTHPGVPHPQTVAQAQQLRLHSRAGGSGSGASHHSRDNRVEKGLSHGDGSRQSPQGSRKHERERGKIERTKSCGAGDKVKHLHSSHLSAHTAAMLSQAHSAATTTASSSVPSHSLATSANITPPNVVCTADPSCMTSLPGGATGKEKEKKDRKDKDRLSIMKRLTKSKKSKSPPPDTTEAGATASPPEGSTAHHRSGSLPTDPVEGATAVPTPASASHSHHQKSSSLDSSQIVIRPAKPKPLVRERCRCIVPYPPQSEIELELKLGDVVYVHKKREDGWYKGTLQRTGKTGLFPGSFVQTF